MPQVPILGPLQEHESASPFFRQIAAWAFADVQRIHPAQ
jgi:hypothetical protein